MAHLTLVLHGREVRQFTLNSAVTTIGRAQDNDIVINNLALSRRHAQVEHKGGGRYAVSDLDSQNGVYVNSERVLEPRILVNADTITMGTYQFVFNDALADEPAGPRTPRPRRPTADVTELGTKSPTLPPSLAPSLSQGELEPEHERERERERERESERVPLLVLKFNDVELQRVALRKDTCVIGRGSDCDLQIAERRLSRRHCQIMRRDGRVRVRDLGSQNGTFVNRKRIREDRDLKNGDLLNFADYSVLFVADAAEYNGPDSVHAPRRAGVDRLNVNSNGEIYKAVTDLPEAYEGSDVSAARDFIHPSDLDEDPEDPRSRRPPVSMIPKGSRASVRALESSASPSSSPFSSPSPQSPSPSRASSSSSEEEREPFIEAPLHSRERRKRPRRGLRDTGSTGSDRSPRPTLHVQSARSRPAVHAAQPRANDGAVRALREKPPIKIEDIPDNKSEDMPDSGLRDWFAARSEKSEIYEEEVSVLIPREKSSLSRILSTMMVGNKELDKNLSIQARVRKFSVDVRSGGEKIFSGPLLHSVTILGTDHEADIQLKGRYVAGRHSLLVCVRDSLLLVRLGSSSAARVNGLPKLQAFLKNGDVIQIDETTIKIQEE